VSGLQIWENESTLSCAISCVLACCVCVARDGTTRETHARDEKGSTSEFAPATARSSQHCHTNAAAPAQAESVTKHTSTFQMVHVVSMLDVPTIDGSVSFQSNDVSGAQNSLFLFCVCWTSQATQQWRQQWQTRQVTSKPALLKSKAAHIVEQALHFDPVVLANLP
jgi:hypothetical protein